MRASGIAASILLLASQLAGQVAAASEWIACPRSDAPVTVAAGQGVVRGEPVFSDVERALLRASGKAALAHCQKLLIQSEQDVSRIKKELQGRGITLDPNGSATLQAHVTRDEAREALETLQWGLQNRGERQPIALDDLTTTFVEGVAGQDIGDDPALHSRANRLVKVAVLDTGIDLEHPDLAERIHKKEGECQALQAYRECLKSESQARCDARGLKLDTDGDGYPLDCSGWSTTAQPGQEWQVQDELGHGTHVSGVIAAAANGTGIRGVTQNARIIPVRVIRSAPNAPIRPAALGPSSPAGAFADTIARGMLYAISQGAEVIHMSLAWPGAADSRLMQEMLALASEKGVAVVAAAGNDSTDSRVFPCQTRSVICVGAHGPDGKLSHFSNHGPAVDLLAPGLNILSDWPLAKRSARFTEYPGYDYRNGTSMAAPFVSGAFAALLAAGIGVDEAYARLMAGSRGRDPQLARGGLLDLGGATAAAPRALILPSSKQAVPVRWDRRSRELVLPLALTNRWAPAENVTLELASSAAGVSVMSSRIEERSWAAGEERRFSVRIRISGALESLPGRLLLRAKVSADLHERTQLIPFDLYGEISEATGAIALPIRGASVSSRAGLRTITRLSLPPKSFPDYLAIEADRTGSRTQLLRHLSRGEVFEASTPRLLEGVPPGAMLLVAQEIDWNLDGSDELILIFKAPATAASQREKIVFHVLSSELAPLAILEHDNQVSTVPEKFFWLRAGEGASARLVPAWIAAGLLPEREKPGFDPWDPEPKELPDLRLYYLASDGLRVVSPPKDHFFVAPMAVARERAARGEAEVVLARGQDFGMEFFRASVTALKVGEPLPLALPRFRMLFGLDNVLSALPLDGSPSAPSTAFAGASVRSSLRLTLVSGQGSETNLDARLDPTRALDSVLRVSAVFTEGARAFAFSESHYSLQFHDLVTGASAATSLGRFSFLPMNLFSRNFFPVVVGGSANPRLPGLLVSAGMSSPEDPMEVIVPELRSDGTPASLGRPAIYRLRASRGCELLGNPVPADGVTAARVVAFCGDRFLSLSLSP